jgi:hypothetical protein
MSPIRALTPTRNSLISCQTPAKSRFPSHGTDSHPLDFERTTPITGRLCNRGLLTRPSLTNPVTSPPRSRRGEVVQTSPNSTAELLGRWRLRIRSGNGGGGGCRVRVAAEAEGGRGMRKHEEDCRSWKASFPS